ncbi:MAG: Gfo/Idh/MocA family oxidoreductase [Spirochaetales bacterium]|nr:Gfo/Idh/MocA family oxidoreductase [Spirochaetales bacterium]
MHKIAIIGCGRISFKHVEAITSNNELDFVAVCDVLKERAVEKADEYVKQSGKSAPEVFTDYKKLLADIKPDIVTIATESGYHPQITVDALEAGCHVICEKPMALSIKDADWMIETADKCGKKLAVSFQNRFNAPVVKTREALEAGRFGRMMHGMVQIRWNRNEGYYSQAPWRGTWALDGGTLMNQCTHGIDLLQWMMNSPVKRVHGVTRRYQRPIEAEDFGSAILEFEDGSVGMIEGTANIYPTNLNETLSLFGESGSVVIGGLAVNKFETWRFADSETIGDPEETVIDPDAKDPPSVYGFGHTALFADFADSIKENRKPMIDGREGKKALEIILAIYKSMKDGIPIDLPFEFSTTDMKKIFS